MTADGRDAGHRTEMTAHGRDAGHRFMEVVESATTPAQRVARAAAFIASAALRAGVTSIVVSGGAAVVLATADEFATTDIDLITPEGDRLDSVLQPMGFERRNPVQHSWSHREARIGVQVVASFLPPGSDVEMIRTDTGHVATIWSTTDLTLDRLAQAVFFNAREMLAQALALRAAAGHDFDDERARRRAGLESPLMSQALELFLDLYAGLSSEGPSAPDEAARTLAVFWAAIEGINVRG
jgi:hypothetical protein